MGFESELVVQQTGDFDWKVMQPLQYRGNTDAFVVPTGSGTDFASVSEIFQWRHVELAHRTAEQARGSRPGSPISHRRCW